MDDFAFDTLPVQELEAALVVQQGLHRRERLSVNRAIVSDAKRGVRVSRDMRTLLRLALPLGYTAENMFVDELRELRERYRAEHHLPSDVPTSDGDVSVMPVSQLCMAMREQCWLSNEAVAEQLGLSIVTLKTMSTNVRQGRPVSLRTGTFVRLASLIKYTPEMVFVPALWEYRRQWIARKEGTK